MLSKSQRLTPKGNHFDLEIKTVNQQDKWTPRTHIVAQRVWKTRPPSISRHSSGWSSHLDFIFLVVDILKDPVQTWTVTRDGLVIFEKWLGQRFDMILSLVSVLKGFAASEYYSAVNASFSVSSMIEVLLHVHHIKQNWIKGESSALCPSVLATWPHELFRRQTACSKSHPALFWM